MSERERNAERWSAHEQALRNQHGELSLMVRHQVYARPDGHMMTAGGWAFLDGEPAIVPMDLDLLIVSVFGADGSMETMARDPAAVISLLGDRVTNETSPIAHWSIRVPEAEKPGLLDQIKSLPEHTPAQVSAAPALAPTMPGPAPFAPAAQPVVPTAKPLASSSAAAGIGLAGVALLGGGCLLLLLALAGAGAALVVFRSSPEPRDRYEPYEPPEAYDPPVAPAPPPMVGTGDPLSGGNRFFVPLPASAPSRGAVTAPLTIQVFSDFQCPFCARVNPTLAQIEETYEGRVRIVWRHYPLPFHRNAMPAAEASMEVFEQGGDTAFWAYHDLLFENQRALDANNLVALAGRVPGVNAEGVAAALADHRHRARVESDIDAVSAAGMRIGTPSFLIGERYVSGAQPFARFAPLIDIELAGG